MMWERFILEHFISAFYSYCGDKKGTTDVVHITGFKELKNITKSMADEDEGVLLLCKIFKNTL